MYTMHYGIIIFEVILMKQINLGGSELSASRIVLGCMRISQMDDAALSKHLNTALELGINNFDHADIYGKGECETKFGKILATELKRDEIILQSKCGIRYGHTAGDDIEYYDLSKEHIIDSADGILRRLGTDYLDLLMLHRPDSLMEPEEIAEAFDRLEQSGKVRHFGLSNFNASQFDYVQQYSRQKLVTNQMQFGPAEPKIINSGIQTNTPFDGAADRDGGLLDYVRRNDVTLQAWSPFHYGYFDGIFLDDAKYAALNEKLEAIGKIHGISKSAAAVAWILRHPAKMQTIIGTTNTERLKEIAKADEISLSRPEWYSIYESAGHVIP